MNTRQYTCLQWTVKQISRVEMRWNLEVIQRRNSSVKEMEFRHKMLDGIWVGGERFLLINFAWKILIFQAKFSRQIYYISIFSPKFHPVYIKIPAQ